MYVSEIMNRFPASVVESESLTFATALLRKLHVRHLPVVREGNVLVGLLTERDILRAAAGKHARQLSDVLIGDAMTQDIASVRPDSSLREAIQVILKNKFGCLPVVSEGKLVGLITESDLVRFAAKGVESEDNRRLAQEYDRDA